MMRFFDDLVFRAGLSQRRTELLVLLFGLAALTGFSIAVFTNVIGLGLCIALLALAAGLEALRVKAESRQRHLDASWPQVFDAFQSAAVSGIGVTEQFEHLANRGPVSHRSEFSLASKAIDSGQTLYEVMPLLQQRFSSRHGDLLIRLLELDAELGGVGMAKTFSDAANYVRGEQGELGQLLAKQGWVSLSAKIALLAPWLIALVLVQLEQNRLAFATELGSAVLVLGLLLSIFAYFLVNRLGYLPLPKRVLNGPF